MNKETKFLWIICKKLFPIQLIIFCILEYPTQLNSKTIFTGTSASIENNTVCCCKDDCEDDKYIDTYIYFTSEMWPEEGIPVLKSKKELSMYQEPNINSDIIKNQTIHANIVLNYSSTRYHTIKPVTILIEENGEIDAIKYGKIKYLSKNAYYFSGKKIRLFLIKEQKILILQYRAEGEYIVEIDDEIYCVEEFFNMDSEPETEWWVKTNNGTVEGWVLINNDNVEFLPRK